MEILKTLKTDSRTEHWSDALLWLGWALVCGLLPFWATILSLFLYAKPVDWGLLMDHGEFALYAASYIGGCLFVVVKDFKTRGFPSKGILTLLLVTLLLVSAFLFSQVAFQALVDTGDKQVVPLDSAAVRTISWIVLPASLILSYIIAVAENLRVGTDYSELTKAQFDQLNDDFDAMEGGK